MARRRNERIDPNEYRHMMNCFLCGEQFQHGPHVYQGHYVRAWQITICPVCKGGNWDGIVPGRFPHLEPHLKSLGLAIKLNESGWIDIPRI